ncbi:hypothetical protein ACFQ0I_15780 [Mariniflexile aquimaris]|uniref:Uncharacterized protein n=1 Tax=Mariniflexile aquimaris TaxID=881009 RepID=A0ABW3BXK5_9FLAO
MKYHIIINAVKLVESLNDAWNATDYLQLLNAFGFEDTANLKPEEIEEMLFMAISDFEPEEAATIVLKYKLSEFLNDNQIDQISNDMLIDKISEEYADISLHHQLFNINQLLHKAYNGKFPKAKATIVDFEIQPNENITKEIVLKAFNATLTRSNVIKRLFANAIAGNESFDEAESIIWDLKSTGANSYTLTTSEYWMSKDEFEQAEFDAEVVEYEEDEDDND